jgi:hypothetical protein
MIVYEDALELAMAPERWYVDLVSGETLEVLTHGYSIREGTYVFSLLFRGTPHVQITALTIPEHLVAAVHD